MRKTLTALAVAALVTTGLSVPASAATTEAAPVTETAQPAGWFVGCNSSHSNNPVLFATKKNGGGDTIRVNVGWCTNRGVSSVWVPPTSSCKTWVGSQRLDKQTGYWWSWTVGKKTVLRLC